MDISTMLGGGALAGVVISAWSYIRDYLRKIFGLVFITIDATDGEFKKAIYIWLNTKCKTSKFSLKRYLVLNNFVIPKDKNQLIAYHNVSDVPTIYWIGKIPILVSGRGEKITFIRGILKSDKVVEQIVDSYNEILGDRKEINRFHIRKFHGNLLASKSQNHTKSAQIDYPSGGAEKSPCSSDDEFYKSIEQTLRPIKWKKEEIGQSKKSEPMSHLSLSPECGDIIESLKLWRKSEKWYKSKQIPWKKGLLMYGAPGCGKSSLAKALAMELNMPIMIFDMSSMSNDDFNDAWDRVKSNSPCIILLEDIDSIFEGRKNIAHSEGGITFDCLLNAMDGVESADGILIIATTNNIDKIDPALGKPSSKGNISTRPGRIDTAIELKAPTPDGLRKIANRILVDFPSEIDRIVSEGENDTGAMFQERCSRLALALFWKDKK